MQMIHHYLQATEAVTHHHLQSYVQSADAAVHNQFVSYFSLFYVEEFLVLFNALLICVATARLWRFLRFGQFFKILERTLSMASFPLGSVSLAFGVILVAFGLSGLMIFGSEFTELSTIMHILATLIMLTLKPEDFPLTEYAKMDLGYIFFSVYLLLMQIVLFIYVTVAIMAYTKAQVECSVFPERYTVRDYIRERIDYIPKLIRHKVSRLRAGQAGKKKKMEPVTPKADEFRYANCLGVPKSRMQAMRFIVSCVVRLANQTAQERRVLTNYEAELALGVCNQFVLRLREDDEVELFFKGHFEGESFRVVDEKKITTIAKFTEKLLQSGEEEEEKFKIDPRVEKFMQIIKANNITLKCCLLLVKLLSCKIDGVEKNVKCLLENEFQ